MANIVVELQDLPYYSQSVVLDGKSYLLTFRWSGRSWFLDIDSTLKGVKIVTGIDILAPYHYKDIPPGKLGAIRNSGTESKPTLLNFGAEKDISLVYEPTIQ